MICFYYTLKIKKVNTFVSPKPDKFVEIVTFVSSKPDKLVKNRTFVGLKPDKIATVGELSPKMNYNELYSKTTAIFRENSGSIQIN